MLKTIRFDINFNYLIHVSCANIYVHDMYFLRKTIKSPLIFLNRHAKMDICVFCVIIELTK